MFFKIFIVSFASMAAAQVSLHDPNYCFATDPIRPQLGMFSTVTAYENSRGDALNVPLSTCTPRRFWMIARGGSRLPSEGRIRDMRAYYQELRTRVNRSLDLGFSSLCRADADLISRWVFNDTITEDRAKELLDTGFAEFKNLALRYQTAFPELLPRAYDQTQFRFRHTNTERTEDSALAFAQGLFGHQNVVFDEVPTLDRLLRPIDSCRLYDEWADNKGERNAFRGGIDFRQMVEQVNEKLGLRGSEAISATSSIFRLLDFCAYEQNWSPDEPSAWCAAFSIANHQVMEYQNDLDTFYTSGYGGDERLFSNMNCHAIQDLLQFLQTTTNPNLARVHITHQTMMRLFLVTLGAFRDEEHLTRHNFAQQIRRQWNSSRISPAASNLVFVRHICDGEDDDIVIYYNERPLVVPGCEAPGLCKQATFIGLFERFLNANCAELYCSRN